MKKDAGTGINVKLIPEDGVRGIQFVEDGRPQSLKKLDKTVVEKTVKTLGDYELKRKSSLKNNPYHYDVEATKYYFSTKPEGFSRILIVLSQFLSLVTLLFFLPSLSQNLAQLILSLISTTNNPFTGPLVSLGEPLVVAILVIFAISWTTIFLFIIVPTLITRTLRSVRAWAIIIGIVGSLNEFFIIGIVIVQIFRIGVTMNAIPWAAYILGAIVLFAFLLFVIGAIMLRINRKKYQRKIETQLANEIRYSKL